MDESIEIATRVKLIADRRQRAREAFYDTAGWAADPNDALMEAIEVATQVKLTDDIVQRYGTGRFDPEGHARRSVMREVLEAAGFEVIE